MNIFNQLPCPALITDINGLIIDASDAMYRLVATNAEAFLGQSSEKIFTKASNIMMQSHVWPTLFKNGFINEIYINIKSASGDHLPAYVNVNTIKGSDEAQYCWIFFIVKERAEFERKLIDMREQLQQVNGNLDTANQSLRHANSELDQFAYLASHDLKEPVRTLSTFSAYLIDDVKAGNEKRVNQDINYIQSACARMTALINDLLEYSKAGISKAKISKIFLWDLLGDVEARLLTQIDESGALIDTQLDVESVFGDYSSLSLVVQNLLQNAMKFRKADIPLKIFVSSNQTHLGGINLVVSDNGIGIAEHMQGQIFDAFKKVHSANEYPGTGIGLAIVAKIIKRHNGTIGVASSLHEGACFTIFLPHGQED